MFWSRDINYLSTQTLEQGVKACHSQTLYLIFRERMQRNKGFMCLPKKHRLKLASKVRAYPTALGQTPGLTLKLGNLATNKTSFIRMTLVRICRPRFRVGQNDKMRTFRDSSCKNVNMIFQNFYNFFWLSWFRVEVRNEESLIRLCSVC